MTLKNNRIALDCDGVLLAYPPSYAVVWERAFGEKLTLVRPEAYHAQHRYGVEFPSLAHQEKFFAHFTEDIWESMAALPGAVAACHQLVAAGYRLICVSALPQQYESARTRNLARHGFPIDQVIATGRGDQGSSKTEVIHRLMPRAFVDDLATNFIGVDRAIHTAFIDTGAADAPDPQYHLTRPASRHPTLAQFAQWWLGQSTPDGLGSGF
jgi:phosphoglycolate phosphatase-like HAD superfamily hydrolase